MTLLPDALYRCRVLILAAVLAIVVKVLMDAFLRTKGGMLLRAAGDNPQFVTSLGRDQGNMKILGLAIGNGCTALAGSILAQQASATVSIGTGMVVQALASVIIGASVFGRIRRLKPTSAVLLGTILYKGGAADRHAVAAGGVPEADHGGAVCGGAADRPHWKKKGGVVHG